MEKNFVVGAVALAVTLFSGLASASEPLRLIQTGPQTRQWMSEAQVDELSEANHEAGRCPGFFDVTDFRERTVRPAIPFTGKSELTEQATVEKLLPELKSANLNETVKSLQDFGSRYYKSNSGVKAAEWIKSRFTELAHGRSDITVELFKHRFIQPSVIARIQGKGPKADEIVVVGGHLDSINRNNQNRAPGADDDASGVATVIEAFRVLSESGFQPERTLEFMGYAGEELGLLGSQDIAESYSKQGKKVAAVLQFDMTGFPGSGQVIHLITDHVNKDLTDFTKKLIDAYAKVPWKTTECGYACSDHASWTDAGYPSVFPFEAAFDDDNKAIHSERDTIEKIDFGFATHYAKVAVGFLVELAK